MALVPVPDSLANIVFWIAKRIVYIIPPDIAFLLNASFIMVLSRVGIWFRFVINTINPIVRNIIIINGNTLLQIFEIVFMPFMIAIDVRIVTISAISILSRPYISVVRVVIVLFWIDVNKIVYVIIIIRAYIVLKALFCRPFLM